jgi:very-short-patch-repair endonuclease
LTDLQKIYLARPPLISGGDRGGKKDLIYIKFITMKWSEIKEIATRLRNKPTQPEAILWEVIRNRQLMRRKFLRQHPLIYDVNRNANEFFFFIPDFYCASEKLIIELDGPIHDFQKEKDYHREQILLFNNLRVLRITNEELDNIEQVKKKITDMFEV